MSSESIVFNPELYQYYQQHTVRPHAVLAELRAHTLQLNSAAMQICPEQGGFMQLLLKTMQARRVLEIGTYTGYSSLSMALALPEDGQIIACDINAEWTEIAKQYWEKAGVAHKIDLRLAPALQTLQHLLDEGAANSFDFVFIDADKENYPAYYELALKLIRKGGVIAVDNVLWYGRVADKNDTGLATRVIRQLNETIYQDPRVEMCMLPIGDGLTLAFKKA